MNTKLRTSKVKFYTLILTSYLGISSSSYANVLLEDDVEVIEITGSKTFDTISTLPYTAYVLDRQPIEKANFRNIIDNFKLVPGVLVQKTSYGQGSPFIRGFTGYRNLMLIDGIRLNNSTFRSGPNQYWSTIDIGSVQQIEIIKGPQGVEYGSDGIGAIVNASTITPTFNKNSLRFMTRLAEGENSNIFGSRLNLSSSADSALTMGVTKKDFGDFQMASGTLQNSGYDELAYDIKWQKQLANSTVTIAHYAVKQDDVPRTHKTIFGHSFAGTTIGSELQRDHDQTRNLTYAKFSHQPLSNPFYTDLDLTLSYHQQDEERTRLRTGDRFDQQETNVATTGISATLSKHINDALRFNYGLDAYHDDIESYASNNPIQGPVAGDADYLNSGLFAKVVGNPMEQLTLALGARYTYISAESDKIQSPITSDVISLDRTWNNVALALEGIYALSHNASAYLTVAEGFRAPNFSDLSRFDSARSNEFEVPSTNLEPEQYLSTELGLRLAYQSWKLNTGFYYTDIEDQIVRFPTGTVNFDGEFEISKANATSGEVYGWEFDFLAQLNEQWSFRIFGSLNYGETFQFPESLSEPKKEYIGRLMPHNVGGIVNYESSDKRWYAQAEILAQQRADRLSTRDIRDTDRIPPEGTPGHVIVSLRAGYTVSDTLNLAASIENVADKDYRIHGSGQNEVGRNISVALNWDVEFD